LATSSQPLHTYSRPVSGEVAKLFKQKAPRFDVAVQIFAASSIMASMRGILRRRNRQRCCRTGVRSAVEEQEVGVARRGFLGFAAVLAAPGASWAKKTKDGKATCGNLEECRNSGDKSFDELEAQKGPIIEMKGQGIRYREVRVGNGEVVGPDEILDISYEIRKTNGDYVYSLGRGRPDMATDEKPDDFGDTYRVRMGKHDVPIAVEKAMLGMKSGGVRAVEMPPETGFVTSDWKPEPTNFSGKQRMERFRQLLTGNGLQKGYRAAIVLEVEVMKVRGDLKPKESGQKKDDSGADCKKPEATFCAAN